MRKFAALSIAAALMLTAFRPQPDITVTRDEAVPSYPDRIEFHLAATGTAAIDQVELVFRTDAQTCGESETRAVPEDFQPSTTIDVMWTWNLRQAGTIPPGTTVHWQWILRDAAGAEMATPEQTLAFSNPNIAWRTSSSASLDLSWIEGADSFAAELLDAGEDALLQLGEMTGVALSERVRIYVYPSPEEMQADTLFAPDWSGGLAFPAHRAVLLSVDPASLEWGRMATAHELAHVVIGAYTFSCLDSTPAWLSEGLAMAAEGRSEPYAPLVLAAAIADNSLLSVRSLGGAFPADPDLAVLAYAQSESLTAYLEERYGPERMLALLDQFRRGTPVDRALSEIYQLDRDGLEAAWREWVGAPAAPRAASADSTRTPYPTLAPITGPIAASATPSASPTGGAPATGGRPPAGALLGASFGAACALASLATLAIAVLARRRRG
jgi:hypothetical protein